MWPYETSAGEERKGGKGSIIVLKKRKEKRERQEGMKRGRKKGGREGGRRGEEKETDKGWKDGFRSLRLPALLQQWTVQAALMIQNCAENGGLSIGLERGGRHNTPAVQEEREGRGQTVEDTRHWTWGNISLRREAL